MRCRLPPVVRPVGLRGATQAGEWDLKAPVHARLAAASALEPRGLGVWLLDVRLLSCGPTATSTGLPCVHVLILAASVPVAER